MQKNRAYPKYKPSGVEWLGEIPEHWEVKRLKLVAPIVKSKLDDKPDDTPYIALEHIESNTGRLINNGEPQAVESSVSTFRKGDVLFGKLRPYLSKVVHAESDGTCSSELVVFRAPQTTNNRYLFYLMLSQGFVATVNAAAYGVKMPRAKPEQIGDMRVGVFHYSEQQAIADFLAEKCGRIDELIAKKERLIEILKEKRSAIISHAVTNGLDPNVKMKDSGIGWLGNVPEHWEVKKLKYVVTDRLKYGANESAELDDPSLPRYIRITDFGDDGKLRDDTFRSLLHEDAREYLLKEGDILFARSGATVGKTFQFKNYAGTACFAGYLIKATPDSRKMLSDFLDYYTKSKAYDNWKNSIFIQATIQNIGADKYQILYVTQPVIDEQEQICAFLDNETGKIDALVENVGQAIEKLKEYRSAIITAAVTGKIDIRAGV